MPLWCAAVSSMLVARQASVECGTPLITASLRLVGLITSMKIRKIVLKQSRMRGPKLRHYPVQHVSGAVSHSRGPASVCGKNRSARHDYDEIKDEFNGPLKEFALDGPENERNPIE